VSRGVLSLLLALTLGACRKEELPVPPTDLAPALGVDVSRMDQTDTGLFIEVLNKGRGAPAGDSAKIWVDYKGYLPDGKLFDTNEGQGPLLVTLYKDFLIDGLMEGMQGMREGEERLLLIPPALGYGETGDLGYVPRNSWLVFRVRRLADAPPSTRRPARFPGPPYHP
jgi:FKBP-type peptidyl-prolyl cis-trans isomerase FkpA